MDCPDCGKKMLAKETRKLMEEDEIYRLYECLNCGTTFYTVEYEVELTDGFYEAWRNAVITGKKNTTKRRKDGI